MFVKILCICIMKTVQDPVHVLQHSYNTDGNNRQADLPFWHYLTVSIVMYTITLNRYFVILIF